MLETGGRILNDDYYVYQLPSVIALVRSLLSVQRLFCFGFAIVSFFSETDST
ncbi:MAG: hypothetical protein AAFU78_04060 [Cyanobacteria bacterium J06633_2]